MIKIFKSKIFWISLLSLMVIILVGFISKNALDDFKNSTNKEVKVDETTMIDRQFRNFTLYKDSTQYQNDLFAELETIYPVDVLDNGAPAADGLIEQYLDVYSKNFLADFLTLSVKNVEFDRIGGEQFLINEFKNNYKSNNNVQDYYVSRDYYVVNNPDTYTTDLPEVSNLTLISQEYDSTDFIDPEYIIPTREDLVTLTSTYQVEYTNRNIPDYAYYDQVSVTTVLWDNQWTVLSMETNLYNDDQTPISFGRY